MKNINRTKSLIKKECAGYLSQQYSIKNYCCSNDGVCIFYIDSKVLPNCKYFEEGVLPLNAALEIDYLREHNMELPINRKAKSKVKCEKCGESFDANSNRQKHCEKCRKIVKKEQARERQSKLRDKIA